MSMFQAPSHTDCILSVSIIRSFQFDVFHFGYISSFVGCFFALWLAGCNSFGTFLHLVAVLLHVPKFGLALTNSLVFCCHIMWKS